MSLSDLVNENLDEAAFRAKYRAPALLIAVPEEIGEADDDPGMRTEILSRTMIRDALGTAEEALHTSTELVWLEKSDRNPFANLITVGRRSTNDVVLGHVGISKVHATFSEIDGEWYVQDGKSRNGTYLNGERVEAGAKAKVSDGDGVGFGGNVAVRFLTVDSVWAYLQGLRGVVTDEE